MSAFDDYALQFLRALYLETENTGKDYHSARDLHKKYGLAPKDHWISRMADDWEFSYFKDVSKVLGGYDGWDFRISAEGARKIESEIEAKEIVDSVFGAKRDRETASRSDNGRSTEFVRIDSEGWTGPKFVLTDARVIEQIRLHADELRDRVYSTRFESNTDSQDLKSLSDALVAVCSMAEPELGIIERILAHPKFRYTAALTAAVATIRGALGL